MNYDSVAITHKSSSGFSLLPCIFVLYSAFHDMRSLDIDSTVRVIIPVEHIRH